MTLLSDLTDFLHSHRPHGPLTADATEPAWNGYLLTVAPKSPKDDATSVRDLEKRLAEALQDKAEAVDQQTADA